MEIEAKTRPHCRQKININGDTKKTLLQQQKLIIAAAENLIDVLNAATPHGRNYQTVENGDSVCQVDRLELAMQIEQVKKIKEYATVTWQETFNTKGWNK